MQRYISTLLFCLCAISGFTQDSTVSSGQQQEVRGSNTNIALPLLYRTFKLDAPALTSAGVYDANGILLRTLWSDKSYNAGTYPIEWDGKDDGGNAVNASG